MCIICIYIYIDCKNTLSLVKKNQMNLQVSQRWSAGVVRTKIDHAPTSHPCISKYIHLHMLCRCKDYFFEVHL